MVTTTVAGAAHAECEHDRLGALAMRCERDRRGLFRGRMLC